MSKLVFIYITLLLPSFLFAGNKRVITWDKLGQTEIIKKGEDFEFLYRNANPENTRILLKPSNKSDEFILELNRYNIVDKALENKKSDQVENDSLVRILQKENSNLVFRVKNNKIYLEEENKISQKLNKTIEKISTPFNKNNSTINKEDIAVQANRDIISIQKDISSNLSEMERNRIVIEKIKGKINGLGNSKADNLLGQQFHLLVDSLEQKNSYLARSNQLLVIDKNLLVKDKEIIELQIAKEIN
ncbi:MAG: hypothetical protein NTW25_03940, partial [Candidatus Kapabacteria bacterium]|nr:hypothetical protein [Candidatus Kapabacteria bacterium]